MEPIGLRSEKGRRGPLMLHQLCQTSPLHLVAPPWSITAILDGQPLWMASTSGRYNLRLAPLRNRSSCHLASRPP